MDNVINKNAYENFNTSFGNFVANESVNESTIAQIDKFILGGVTTLKAGSGDFKCNLFRSAAQVASNNQTREIFKKSVADVFGGENKIPDSVKKAMKWEDFDGKGHPLSARRIGATLKQINIEVKREEVRNALNAQDWFRGTKVSAEVKNAFGDYQNQLVTEMSQAMERLLLPSIQKGKAPSVEKMKMFLKQFENESEATDAILNDIKKTDENIGKNAGESDREIGYAERKRAIEVNLARGCVRSAAFALAIAKNDKIADFFFGTSKASNLAFKNFNLAYDEIDNGYIDSELRGVDMTKERDAFKSNLAPIQQMVLPARAYYIIGMSTDDAIAEMMRLSKYESQKETLAQGMVVLHDVIVALEMTPGSKSKDVLAGFYKKVGKQAIDGTIRAKNTRRGLDQFYEALVPGFKNYMTICKKNRGLNATNGNHAIQPEWVMDSREQDVLLLNKLDELFFANKRKFYEDYLD